MTTPIRITGIVRLGDTIFRELSRPITQERRAALQTLVASRLAHIESLLMQHGLRAGQLPARSRKSLMMLRSINWNRAPLGVGSASPPLARPTLPDKRPAPVAADHAHDRARGQPMGPTPTLRPKTLRKSPPCNAPDLARRVEQALRFLSVPVSDAQAEQLRQSLEKQSRETQLNLHRRAIEPARMSDTFRQNRAWAALMSDPGRLLQYRRAQQSFRAALLEVDARRRLGQNISIQFRPMRGLYKFRITPGGAFVWLPTPMIAFDESNFAALARMMLRRTPGVRQHVLEAVDDEPYQSLRVYLESLAGPAGVEPGTHHDLIASFDRVNAGFLNNQMARPRLIWSRSITHRQMGYYQRASDTLMISRSLDRPDVELFVLDFLMYHELLHKKHGTRWSRGRGYVHTPDFYADEHRFPRHQEADDRLSDLAMSAAAQ